MKINIQEYIKYTDKDIKERTKSRLEEIIALGMTEVGNACFGVEGIMSGLYIEMVWSFDAEVWKDHMEWSKSLIIDKTNNNEHKNNS